jgi:DnaJ-class molecular chaperone
MVIKCKKNYYEILGVTPDSDANEIKTSYRNLARKYHPDVNKAPDSSQKFKDVLEAYKTLSDTVKRKQYDMVNGFYKKTENKKVDNNSNSQSNFKRTKSHYEDDFDDFEDFVDSKKSEDKTTSKNNNKKENFNKKQKPDNYSKWFFKSRVNSILDEISKNHNKEAFVKQEPKNGDDVNTSISITVEEAINGTERVLNIMHKEVCPHCKGRKFINGAKCQQCEGTGFYQENRKITVKVPSGVKNNSKLRLVGEGNPGFFGGKNGNLYITLLVESDKNIKIDGNNICYNLAVSPFEAVLGGEIDIPNAKGNIKFVLPKMTNSGQQFRIAKKGIETNGHVGDMIITVVIQLPEKLSGDEIKMYEKLKDLSKSNVRE